MNKLPEKWKIKLSNTNIAVVGNYFNKQSMGSCYSSLTNYQLYSHNLQKQSILIKGNLSKSFSAGYGHPDDYTEITFDQFKQFVLKQSNNLIFKTYI